MDKKNWTLTLRIDGITREWMERVLEWVLLVGGKTAGGTVSGGFAEAEDEEA